MKRIAALLLLLLFILPLCACAHAPSIPYISDGSTAWDSVTEIRLYSDGYYGRSLEDGPLAVTEPQTIEKLVNAALDVRSYKAVAAEKALESLNELWIDFGNGCVIGMLCSEAYGAPAAQLSPVPQPAYRLPKALWRQVNDLLAAAEKDS